jgi:hypothetical protein
MSWTPHQQKRYNIATELYHKYPERFEIVSICDKLGYSQHIAECWIDTIQELFFYTDDLKELTQPLFYHLKDEDIETRVNNNTDIEPSEKDDYIQGLKSMRDRFIQHYDFMMHGVDIKACQDTRVVRQMYKAMCSEKGPSEEYPTAPLMASLRTKSATLGINIGMRFQTLKQKKERTAEIPYKPGGIDNVEEVVLNRLFKLFHLPFQVNVGSPSLAPAIGIRMAFFRKKAITSKGGYLIHKNLEMKTDMTHVTGFFKCEDTWYYYDNMSGLWLASDYIIDQIMFCKEHKINIGIHREKSDGKVYLYAYNWSPLKSEEDIAEAKENKKMANTRGNISLPGQIQILNICTEDGWTDSLDHPVLNYINDIDSHKYLNFRLNTIQILFHISKNTGSSITGGRPSMKVRNKNRCSRKRVNHRRFTRRSKLLQ